MFFEQLVLYTKGDLAMTVHTWRGQCGLLRILNAMSNGYWGGVIYKPVAYMYLLVYEMTCSKSIGPDYTDSIFYIV